MSEEDTTPTAPAATEATENGAAAADTKPEGKGPRRKKEDDKPIEELYDLSQPIPRAEKPDKPGHESALKEINDEFEKLKNERIKLQAKIEEAMSSGKNTELGKARDAMAGLRAQKSKLIDQKKAIRAQLDSLKAAGDKIVKDKKDAKSSVKFSSVADIDKEIAKLQKMQETTSMSLTEEKKLIKEMDSLQASKSKIKDVASKDNELLDVREKRNLVQDQIKAKDKEIDAVSKEMDVVGSKIKEMSEKDAGKKSILDDLFKKRDGVKKDIAAVLKKKDAMRDEFREKNNTWWNYQRAVKAQKKIQYEEEKKKRDEEREAFLKAKEEEELKKIPYEEEQALCDYLADYLERTYISPDSGASSKVTAVKEEVVAVKEDPFAGMMSLSKKSEEEVFFGKGKSKKKRQRASKKAEEKPFTLNVDSFEQFGLIGLNPPTSLDQVEASVKELRERKEWYKDQPRGSVPTAKDIRKQNEKNAAKVIGSSTSNSTGKSGGSGKFNLSNDEFVPLGKGASSAVDASASQWGKSGV
mmetsp:Transcript_41288/g.98869  ORF Transcript_41288/g.98869 Transcript_41288/m.98869 type:complete len:526 (-) Transcript_41288:269-1846(-)